MLSQIIKFLKNTSNYISGEEISQSLKISRTAVWKYIQELRQRGYEIVAVPHLGYKLVSAPDLLLAEEIQFQLGTRVVGNKVVCHDTVSSTMDEAFRLGMEGAPDGTVVCAEGQTRGRGRLGRNWASARHKGIYISVILRPKFPPTELAKLTLWAAVAVSEALEKSTGVSALIKWPNDLLVGEKKVAGILTELRAEVDQVKFVVIGIGVNVNHTAHQLIETGTSLRVEAQKTFLRVDVLKEILRSLERRYLELNEHGFKPVLDQWKKRSVTLKKWVRIADPAGVVEGQAIDLDDDGGLLIRQDSGVVIKKMAGDVVQVR